MAVKILAVGARQPIADYGAWVNSPWVSGGNIVQMSYGVAGLRHLADEVAARRPDEVWLLLDDPGEAMRAWVDDQLPNHPRQWEAANAWRDSLGAAVAWLAATRQRFRIFTVGQRHVPLPSDEAESLANSPGLLFLANVLGLDVPGIFTGAARQSPPPGQSDPQSPRAHFIIGSPFIGSTALGNALNFYYPGLAVGELNRLPQFREMFSGAPITEYWCEECESRGQQCPEYNKESVARLSKLSIAEVFSERLHRSGLPAVVDSSKDPNFLAIAADQLRPEWQVTATILVRDPLASMAAWISAARKEGYPEEVTTAWQAATMWRDIQVNSLRICARLGIAFSVLDFVSLRGKDPREGISPMLTGLGLDPQSSTPLPAPPPASHQVLGNPIVASDPGRRNPSTQRVLEEMAAELRRAWIQTPGAPEVWRLLGGEPSP